MQEIREMIEKAEKEASAKVKFKLRHRAKVKSKLHRRVKVKSKLHSRTKVKSIPSPQSIQT